MLGDREHEDPRGGCTGQCWVTENMKIHGEAVQDTGNTSTVVRDREHEDPWGGCTGHW